jgi:hypothetical protein
MSTPSSPASTLALRLALAGVIVVFGTIAIAAPGASFSELAGVLGFSLWALLPYAILAVMGRLISSAWAIGGAGLLALTLEVAIRLAVFVFPQSSTAAVILVFSPVLISAIGLSVGAFLGFIVGRLWQTDNLAIRVVAATVAVAGLGLVGIGIARPELFPTALLFKKRMLERVGEPRVVSGGEAFELVVVHKGSAWFQATDADGAPGDEIAVIENGGIDILDGVTFEKRERIPLGGDGRLWSWNSRLIRLEGKLVIVQTGGGFSDTEVRGTDGTLLWSYRPDPELAPDSLRPHDLDGDGVSEFYATTHRGLVRLDERGAEVWRRPATLVGILDLAPRTATDPSVVVGSGYQGLMLRWDDAGQAGGEVIAPGDSGPLGLVDFPERRGIATAGAALHVIGFDGKTVFTRPVEEGMGVRSALSVRATASAPARLAVVTGTSSDIGRARLLVLDAGGGVLYDELFGKAPAIFKAKAADGAETLFISAEEGLRALRPRVR